MSQQGKPLTTYHTRLIKTTLRLFFKPQKPVCVIDNYVEQQLHVFANIHNKIHEKSQTFRVEIMAKQHKKAARIIIKKGDVMVRLPDRNSKLSPMSTGPCYVVRNQPGNEYEVYDPVLTTKK